MTAKLVYEQNAMSSDQSHTTESLPVDTPPGGHAVIAGFGVPGRAVAELLTGRNMPFRVIEANPQTVERCAQLGFEMIAGDVSDERTLRQAGVDRAALFAIAVPNDAAVLEAVRLARAMNPTVHILARCHFISAGMEARRRGANEVVIEEQMVGEEFVRRVKGSGKLIP